MLSHRRRGRPPPPHSSCSSRVSEKSVSQRFPPSRRRPVRQYSRASGNDACARALRAARCSTSTNRTRSSAFARPSPPDADVAGGLEQSVVAKLNEASADAQVYFTLGVFGQIGACRLGDPVVAEPVSGVAADRVGDATATAVDGFDETKLETCPQCLGHHVGRLRGRCRRIVEVELPADAGQRAQDPAVDGAQLVEVATEEFGGRRRDLDRGEHAQIPARRAARIGRRECTLSLRAI